MADAVKVTLSGDTELANLLRVLPRRVGSKANRASVTAASKPIRTALKAKAPRDSNLLAKAVGTKVKTYKGEANTTAVGVTGARRDVQGIVNGRKRVPSRYMHLADKGTVHSQGKHFVAEAYASAKSQARAAGAAKHKEVIEKEAAKLGKK